MSLWLRVGLNGLIGFLMESSSRLRGMMASGLLPVLNPRAVMVLTEVVARYYPKQVELVHSSASM